MKLVETPNEEIPETGQFVAMWIFKGAAWAATYRHSQSGSGIERYDEEADRWVQETIGVSPIGLSRKIFVAQ